MGDDNATDQRHELAADVPGVSYGLDHGRTGRLDIGLCPVQIAVEG